MRNRWCGVIGALLGMLLGVSLHQSNLSPYLFQAQSTWIAIGFIALGGWIGGGLVALLGRLVDKQFESRGTNALLRACCAILYGAVLAFVLAGFILAMAPTGGLDLSHVLNWGPIAIVAAIGAVVGIILALVSIWPVIQHIKQVEDFFGSIRNVLKGCVFLIEAAIGFLERGTKIDFLRNMHEGASDLHDFIEGVKSAAFKVRLLFLGITAGIGLVLGGLCGLIISVPVLVVFALLAKYGAVMLFPGAVAGGIAGLIAGIAFRPRFGTSAIPMMMTGLLVGAFGGELIVTVIFQAQNVLQVAFTHGLVGFGALGGFGAALDGIFSPSGRWVRRSAAGLVGVLVALALLIACGSFLFTALLQGLASSGVTVVATEGWQDTNYFVKAGDHVTIRYLSGTWSVDAQDSAPSDANGQPANPPSFLYCSCGEPLPGVSTQALIGKVGNGSPFLVGDSKEFTATANGDIFLRMNDGDGHFSDNSGSVQVQITINGAKTPTPVPTRSPTPIPTRGSA